MASENELRTILSRIDGRGYKAYKDIKGRYHFPNHDLYIDHVQGDPFAAPSKLRIRVSQTQAKLPTHLFQNPVRRIALEDFLVRRADLAIKNIVKGNRGSGKSGLVTIDCGGQEVLQRSAAVVTPEWVELRIYVGLPAAGRRVLARQAEDILCEELPEIAAQSLFWENLPQEQTHLFVECVENQEHIRAQLDDLDLMAFVADQAILPRKSGVSDKPMPSEQAIPFASPESMRVTMELPNPVHTKEGTVKSINGMGIPKGVTLVIGGGYHGKSTLLTALQRGVYPHIPGDGREYVVTSPDAVKIRAEDGCSMKKVDISPFISNLPFGRSTQAFTTDDASGSTSQAGNIIEALELGAKLLMLDEDTSATNFMIRDSRMQTLVSKQNEPITPFIDRVRELYVRLGVSTILVMGGCGDYFDTADTVIMMRNYLPEDMTEQARQIAINKPSGRVRETTTPLTRITPRIPLTGCFDPSRGRRQVKIDTRGIGIIRFGKDTIDLSGIEQLVDPSQTRAVGYAIHMAAQRFMDGKLDLKNVVEAVEAFFNQNGLDALDPFHRPHEHPGSFAQPRKYEIAAAINRLRSLCVQQKND